MTPELRDALIEQIKRDVETLADRAINNDPCGREFYEQRIRDNREAVRKHTTKQVRE